MAEALVLFCIMQGGGEEGRGGGLWAVISFFFLFSLFFSAERFDKAESDPDNTIAVGSFAKPWFSCVSCVVRIKSCYKKKEKPRKKKTKQTNKQKENLHYMNRQSSIQSEYLS